MYSRDIKDLVKRYAEIFPVLCITGPRQSGKTTIARKIFPHLPYLSLENLDTRELALNDPRKFLSQYPNGAIFDEVQHAPDILSYLQGIVDDSPQKGKYVITGSQNFTISNTVSQSLAGRVGMITLLPLSLRELNAPQNSMLSVLNGGYPALHKSKMMPEEFYPSYIKTYIERDVRDIKNIGDLSKFQTFLKLCAGRTGQLINFSSLATDAGISHTTAREWLSILEASYIIFTLQPFYKNFSKRLIKMPKLYFYDTGLACSLLGIENTSQLETHYLKGGLFENLVILEILKHRFNKGKDPNMYFWRDRSVEIDLICEWGGKISAVEIKSSSTFQSEYIKNLQYFDKLAGEVEKYLVFDGNTDGKFLDVYLTPLSKISDILLKD